MVNEHPHERRKEPRLPSNEAVCFTDSSGWGSLSVGSLQDRSARGIAIQTDSIFSVGTPIEIEVVSTDGHEFDAPQFSTGEVSHIQPRPQGGYILGVLLNAPKELQAQATSVSRTASLSASMKYPASNFQETFTRSAHSPIKETSVTTKPQRAYAQQIASLGILLLAVTLFLGWGIQESRTSSSTIDGVGNSLVWTSESSGNVIQKLKEDDSKTSSPDSKGDASTGHTILASSLDWEAFGSLPEDIVQATSLPERSYPLSTQAPQAVLGSTEGARTQIASLGALRIAPKSVAQMHAILQQAQEAARKGNHMGALYLSKEAVDSAATLPEPWQKVAQNFRQQLLQVPGAMPTLPELSNALSLSQALPELPTDASVVVHVDKSDFLMQVVKDGKVVWQFPIGLGLNNSTPEGIFSVGNKISLPEWYNKGNPVKGGAANNPLGKSWLGLSDQGTATPIGIHPTKQGESIGEALSGGCIRMRPEDAERLYRMIPIGTPIVIRS